jgi:hypothetical protein
LPIRSIKLFRSHNICATASEPSSSGSGLFYRDRWKVESIVPRLPPPRMRVVLEPGRFLVGNAGVLLIRVLYCKKTPNKVFIIVDVGMNDLSPGPSPGTTKSFLSMKVRTRFAPISLAQSARAATSLYWIVKSLTPRQAICSQL